MACLGNKVMRKYINFLILSLFIVSSFLVFNSGLSLASSGGPSGTCSVNGSSFFGFPTWYKYLPGGQDTNNSGNSTGSSKTTTICSPQFQGLNDIWLVVAAVVDMLLYIVGFGSVIMIIYGGISYTTSMGNPESTAKAKNTIIYSVVGLVIAISASFLVTFIATSVLGAS